MKQRIITALIWLPIVVAITWWGNIPFVLMMLGFLAVGIWETHKICAAKGRGGDIGLLLPLVLYLLVGFGSLLALRVIWPNPLLVLFGWPALPVVWLALCVLALVLAMTGAGGCLVRKGEHRLTEKV